MKQLRWLALGYFMAFLLNGCDIGITSPGQEDFEISSCNGLGSSQWNPVYVRIVE